MVIQKIDYRELGAHMLSPFTASDWQQHLTPVSPHIEVRREAFLPPVYEGSSGERIRLGLKLHHRLYKFSEPKWIKAFFDHGDVRIGTLFEYQGLPADGQLRQDDREGIHEFCRPDGSLLITPALNQWLFCATTSYSGSRRRRFGGDGYEIEDVRFFLELTKELQKKVGNRLRDVLLAPVEYRGPDALYRELGGGKFAGFIKRTEYEWQSEARAAWEFLEPQEQHVAPPDASGDRDTAIAAINDYLSRQCSVCQPMVLRVPDAVQFCRRLSRL